MNITPIATIQTPFREKFVIPRQANIIREAQGIVSFTGEYQCADSLRGLSAHSHYWLIWGFSEHTDRDASLTVRPPRLGGNERTGVFSTRSPFRPNNLGLSVVTLEAIHNESCSFTVSGVDMLDGTPIYDIKPYIPYADSIASAYSEWANDAPIAPFSVEILEPVKEKLYQYEKQRGLHIVPLITALLRYDPRPAYKSSQPHDDKIYATKLYDVDIRWVINDDRVDVVDAEVLI